MLIRPEDDGITHINVYSKGKTELGRLLSNFADTPFEWNGYKFRCVEGYWYWTITGDTQFVSMKGWQAKQFGKTVPAVREHPSREELKQVYAAKLQANPKLKGMLKENKLPFEHYYVYGTKVVQPKEWRWTAELWNEFR